jgi:hypothetical protein
VYVDKSVIYPYKSGLKMDRMSARIGVKEKILTSVILGSYIVGQIVIKNKAQQTIEQSQINLLVNLR